VINKQIEYKRAKIIIECGSTFSRARALPFSRKQFSSSGIGKCRQISKTCLDWNLGNFGSFKKPRNTARAIQDEDLELNVLLHIERQAEKLLTICNKESQQRVQHILKKHTFFSYIVRKVLVLFGNDLQRRIEFCTYFINVK
jgi:hypothetical protein